jgi:hypothetical protein
LRTKSYVVDGAESTETDLPILGKIKTNYPALVFVAVGAGLALYALQASKDLATAHLTAPDDEWVVTGQVLLPPNAGIDVRDGVVAAVPSSTRFTLNQDGSYVLTFPLQHGVALEDVISQIDYTAQFGSFHILTQDELKAYDKDPSHSLLASKTSHSRSYKPVMVTKVGS